MRKKAMSDQQKVHILESHVDYEGSTLYDIFSTPEKAMEYAEKELRIKKSKWSKSADGYMTNGKWETYTITEMEVR